jgi:plastocyanin
MPDLDQRVVEGLHELAGRAPLTADLWPATRKYVGRHRRTRRALAGSAMVVVLAVSGLAAVAVAHHDGTNTRVSTSGRAVGNIMITASPDGTLTYAPLAVSVRTGYYDVTLVDGSDARHTLYFGDTSTHFGGLTVNSRGERKTARVFFGERGDYHFFCIIARHRAAGMYGVVHVTGPELTYAPAATGG